MTTFYDVRVRCINWHEPNLRDWLHSDDETLFRYRTFEEAEAILDVAVTDALWDGESPVRPNWTKGEVFPRERGELIDNGDRRIDDKWGPAGCIDLGNGKWLFFGWVSE